MIYNFRKIKKKRTVHSHLCYAPPRSLLRGGAASARRARDYVVKYECPFALRAKQR
jgi:hypothetical protein